MITSVCSAPSPPENSSTPATAPWATPQKTTSQRIGSSLPCWLSIPITIEAESAPVMKKIATRKTASTTVMLASGYSRSMAKSAPSRALLGEHLAEVLGAGELQVEGRARHDREPDERHHARHQDHVDDELADRAALGDARDEHADEGRPRDPPGPVEDRPAVEELAAAEGAGAERHRRQVGQVAAERLGEGAEDEDGRPDDEEEEDQRQRPRPRWRWRGAGRPSRRR